MKRFLVLVFTLVTMLSTHSYAEQNQNSTGEMPVRLELATAIKKSICVYDPLGKKGDIYNIVNDYALDMATTGVQFELIPFTDESVAVGDFLARQCDMIAATDIRLRPFSKFAGTISAVGALPTTEDLRILLRALNRRKAEKLYGFIDTNDFYANPVAKNNRSRMNVPFTLADAALDKTFLAESEPAGLMNLAGHRSVGGMRASIYNAVPEEGVDALIAFMADFAERHG